MEAALDGKVDLAGRMGTRRDKSTKPEPVLRPTIRNRTGPTKFRPCPRACRPRSRSMKTRLTFSFVRCVRIRMRLRFTPPGR